MLVDTPYRLGIRVSPAYPPNQLKKLTPHWEFAGEHTSSLRDVYRYLLWLIVGRRAIGQRCSDVSQHLERPLVIECGCALHLGRIGPGNDDPRGVEAVKPAPEGVS